MLFGEEDTVADFDVQKELLFKMKKSPFTVHFKEGFDHHSFIRDSDEELQQFILKALQGQKLTQGERWFEFLDQKAEEKAEEERE